MKTKLLFMTVLVCSFILWGQETNQLTKYTDKELNEAKDIFENLKKDFKHYLELYNTANEDLKSSNAKLDGKSDEKILLEIQEYYKKAKDYNDTLAKKMELFKNYKGVYVHKGFAEKDIDEWFGYADQNFEKSAKTISQDTKVYAYFGKNKILDLDYFNKNTSESAKVLKDIISEKGEEAHFGDITIPQQGQKFNFYRKIDKSEVQSIKKSPDSASFSGIKKLIKKKKTDKGDYIRDPDLTYKFKRLDVEIRDGYFYDIRALVEDDDGNTHIFTNQVGISLLSFSKLGKNRLMEYRYSIRKQLPNKNIEYTDENLMGLYVKLTDVMSYTYKIGNNFIPHNLAVSLPDDFKENQNSNAVYQIRQETHLEKILELRTYTDFLALFGDSGNGLIQVEGKATFFLFPYPFRFKSWGQIEYLPTVSPYVNYSKFEDKNRYVEVTNSGKYYSANADLDLIEKRFLTMGMNSDFFKWQHKNSSVKLSLYGLLNYNITEMNLGTTEDKEVKNIKSLGYGGGLHLSTKRFNNFGFDYKFEIACYEFRNFNDYDNIQLKNNFPVFRHEAEIFYHPNGNPNQAIFTRLVTYNHADNSKNQAFYQFQFGYKFSIGNRKI